MVVILPLRANSVVGRGIMFSVCPSAWFLCLFLRTDRVTTVSHDWLEQSRCNLQGVTTVLYWWPD